MVQGTSSGVGKSLVVAALCRLFARRGWSVAPFKAQNMSLNSGVTPDGYEIGRAQIVQAIASNRPPDVLMNPILLKPEGDTKSQLVVMGRPLGSFSAGEYYDNKLNLWEVVRGAIAELSRMVELVIIEGAGSPVEINLMDRDIVNMRVAKLVDAPVLLVGDIERGGVFASIYGTVALLNEDAKYVKGVIINKFRGDTDILSPGIRALENMIGIPVLGVIPYLRHSIDDEDSISDRFSRFRDRDSTRDVRIGVVKLAFMSNYTDILPLEEDVDVIYFDPDNPPLGLDAVIIPGSKNTIQDLQILKDAGFYEWLVSFRSSGGRVVGICGGYQMLGEYVSNPYGVETAVDGIRGFGLLGVETVLEKQKSVYLVRAFAEGGVSVSGYEIHMGRTVLKRDVVPFLRIVERNGKRVDVRDGALSSDRRVWGTYVHGIFDSGSFRRYFINLIRAEKGLKLLEKEPCSWIQRLDKELDRFSDVVERNVDIEKIVEILSF